MIRYILCLCCVLLGTTAHATILPNSGDTSTSPANHLCYQAHAPRLHLTVPSVEILNRIIIPAGTELHAIEVELSGPPTIAAGEIIIYGHAQGLIAPRTEVPTVIATLSKKHHGIEKVRVPVAPLFRFTGGQAFIGVRNAPDSVRVLLVSDTSLAPCEDQAGSRQAAVYRGTDAEWNQTVLPMAVGLVVKYPSVREGGFVLDTTLDAAADVERFDQPYLSAGDVNGDGLIDLAAAGLLYVNTPSGLVALDLSTEEGHPYIMFVDVDGDGRDDLLTMDLPCATEASSWRWQNGRLRSFCKVDLPGGCVTPVSAVALAEGQKPMILLSAYQQDRPVAMNIALGARPTVVDVTEEFVLDDGIAPILLAADLDDDHNIEVVTRSVSTDRVVRSLGGNEFVELARTTFTALALDLSSSTYTKSGNERGRLEMPRTVSWQEDPQQLTQKSGSLISDPRSNTIARYDERPASRHYADLDNDGTAELIEFGHGDCRSMAVFSYRDDSWRDVTHELGLGDIYGASDGLFVDLDMDGRLDMVVDRGGRVEVRYNRLECPKGTSINLFGAATGTRISTSQNAAIKSLARGHGRLIEDAHQVHVSQPTVDSLIIEHRFDGRQLRSRYGVERNNTIALNTGHEMNHGAADGVQPTMSFNGEVLILRGFESGQSAVLNVVTMNGETITQRRLDHLTDATVVPLQQLLLEKQAASGSYSIQVSGAAGASTLIITFIR